MKTSYYFSQYFETISQSLRSIDSAQLVQTANMVWEVNKFGEKIIVVDNGACAAMASHVAVDSNKNARIRSINFNEHDLITCFANDYGYEH